MSREVAALYGERPPPVAIYDEKKSYKAKRQNLGPAKKWYDYFARQISNSHLYRY